MTDTDIVRMPFFEHHIDEIIGDGVGMVVALVQLNFFCVLLRLMREERASCSPQSRSSASVENGEVKSFPAAVGQKEQAEQEEQRIENREQGSHHRMDHDQLVTHIS